MFTCTNGYWEVYRRFQGIFLVWGGGEVEGDGVAWEDLSMEEFAMGKRISMKGAQNFLALFKKKQLKINMKSFSTQSKEQH